jgi:hypothetical protein
VSQVNVTPEGRGSRAGAVLAALPVLLVVVLLVWAFAFGGFNTPRGAPVTTAPAPSNPAVNVNPSVNLNPPATTGGAPATTTVATPGRRRAPAKP